MALARCNFVVQDDAGNIVDGASVEVRSEASGSLVSVYSDRSGSTPLGNPYTATDGADAGFHVAGGAYKITATKASFTRTWRYVPVGTMQEVDLAGAAPREVLSANRTYYVRSDGSDSNTGLANTSGGAFLTLQKAWDTLLLLDTNGYTVTIKCTGSFTKGIYIAKAWSGGGRVIIEGDTATPANATIAQSTTHSGAGVGAGAIFLIDALLPAVLRIAGFKLSTSGSGTASILLAASGTVEVGGLDLAGNASVYEGTIALAAPGAKMIFAPAYGNITISGNMGCWLQVSSPGAQAIFYSQTITLTGTPVWGWIGVYVARGVADMGSLTFSGSATGTRYYVTQNGIIDTSGGGASYLPGNSSGSAVAQGQYI